MKILQIINSLSSGGAEVFATGLSIALKKLGCEIEVFTYCGAIDDKGIQLEKELSNAGVPHISPIILQNTLKPTVPFYLAREMLRFNPDICHSHLEMSNLFSALAKKITFKKFITVRTIHNVYASNTIPPLIHRWLRSSFDASIACGPAVRTEYPYLCANDPTINNGIDLSLFIPHKNTATTRQKLGINPGEHLLVHIGAFSLRNDKLQKAQDIILHALSRVKNNNYVMVFLGEGEYRKAMETLASSLGIESRCRFLGRVTNAPDYIFASDAILMPSRFEGLSIGCIEAVCAGKPVVASNIAAFSPFQKPSTLFVKPESVQELAVQIDNLLQNINRYSELAKQNEAEYRNEFDLNSVATKYLNQFQLLLSRKKTTSLIDDNQKSQNSDTYF